MTNSGAGRGSVTCNTFPVDRLSVCPVGVLRVFHTGGGLLGRVVGN